MSNYDSYNLQKKESRKGLNSSKCSVSKAEYDS